MVFINDENVIPGIKLNTIAEKPDKKLFWLNSFVDRKTNIEEKKYKMGEDNLIQNSVSPQKKVLTPIIQANTGGFEK